MADRVVKAVICSVPGECFDQLVKDQPVAPAVGVAVQNIFQSSVAECLLVADTIS